MTDKTLAEVTDTGNRRASLEHLRQTLADAIDAGPAPRDLAALSRRLMLVLQEIDTLPKPEDEVSRVDDIAAKRAERSRTAS